MCCSALCAGREPRRYRAKRGDPGCACRTLEGARLGNEFYASDGAPSFAFGAALALDGSSALVGSWAWESPEMMVQGAAYFFASGTGDTIFADGFDGTAP